MQKSRTFDGLNRPRVTTLTVKGLSEATYEETATYDDAAHTVLTLDARGFLTERRMDDLDRVYRVTVDAPGPQRAPKDARDGAALALTTEYEYDGNGNRSAVVDALGRRSEKRYDGLNRLLERTLPMGASESFTYDGEGQVLSHTDVRGIVRVTTRDMASRQRQSRLVESLSNGGAVLVTSNTTYGDTSLDGQLVSTETTDAAGSSVTRYLDAMHREVRTVDAEGFASESRFDFSQPRVTRDRKSFIVEMAYDAIGRLLHQEEKLLDGTKAFSQTYDYDDAAQKVTLTDRRGIVTVDERDGLGRTERQTRGEGTQVQVTRTTFDAAGNAVLSTDPNGHQSERLFDGAGRLVQLTHGLGTIVEATTRYRYDAAGNRVETKGPRATGVAYDIRESFDDLNRAVRTEDALGNVTVRAFDAGGNKLCEKRPRGASSLAHGGAAGMSLEELQTLVCTGEYVTNFAYDEEGKIVAVVDALGGESTFVYDASRRLVAQQDANGHLTTFAYDSMHRRTGEHRHLDAHPRLLTEDRERVPLVEPLNVEAQQGTLTWARTYDAEGNGRTLTDPKGQLTTFTYGALNRLARQDFSGHATPRELPSIESIAYGYDGNGNTTEVTETKLTAAGPVSEVKTRAYDGLDRLESETRYDGKRTAFTYDAKGNRTKVTDADGIATSYAYDPLDRLAAATLAEGTASYTYWPDGLLKGGTLPNGVHEGRCYDASGRLTHQLSARAVVSDTCSTSGAKLSEYVFNFDANGNRKTMFESRTVVGTTATHAEATQYGYDALDRLVGVKYPDATAHLYRLDAVGNRTGERRLPAGLVSALGAAAFVEAPTASLTHDLTSAFDRADRLLSQVDTKDSSRNTAFTWDANGNLTSKERAGLSRQLHWDVRNTLVAVVDNGQEVGRYDYDEGLDRIRRKTAQENVEYVLDEGHVLPEVDGSLAGHPTRRRYHYGSGPLAVSDTPRAVAGAVDATGTSTASFLSTDALGSVVDATDASGAVTQTRQYDAWGNHRGGTAPGEGDFKLGFTGHQFDPETGLVYARARYYDPELGRFISRDSYEGQLDDAPSLHRFAYASFNPLKYTDPTGHNSCGNVNAVAGCSSVLNGGEFVQVTRTTVGAASTGEGAVATGVQTSAAVGSGEAATATSTFQGYAGQAAVRGAQAAQQLPWWTPLAMLGHSLNEAFLRSDADRDTEREKELAEIKSQVRATAAERSRFVNGPETTVAVERRDAPGTSQAPRLAPGVPGGVEVAEPGSDDETVALPGAGPTTGVLAPGGNGEVGPMLATNPRVRFPNTEPNDLPKPVTRVRLENRDGKWVTVSSSGGVRSASGRYIFVRIGSETFVAPVKNNVGAQNIGHVDLARGGDVDYAGEVWFAGRRSRGELRRWDNGSGHYKPSPDAASQAGFPMDSFRPRVFDTPPQPGVPVVHSSSSQPGALRKHELPPGTD